MKNVAKTVQVTPKTCMKELFLLKWSKKMSETVYVYLLRLTHYHLFYGNQIWSKLMHYCQLFAKEFYHHNINPYPNKCVVD